MSTLCELQFPQLGHDLIRVFPLPHQALHLVGLEGYKGHIRLESIRESGQTYAQRSRTTIHEGVIGQRDERRIGQGILLLYPTGDALSPGHKDRLLVLHPEYYLD